MSVDTTLAEESEVTTVIAKKAPPYNNPEYDEIMRHHIRLETDEGEDGDEENEDEEFEEDIYASSSCSISITSDCAPLMTSSQTNQITVPVTIEHPPPELRNNNNNNNSHSSPEVVVPAQHQIGLPRQETAHTDSGLDTEDILPAPDQQQQQPVASQQPRRMEVIAGDEQEAVRLLGESLLMQEEEGVRMVLVRDIGVQVYGDSPSLNSTRRFSHHFKLPSPPPIPEAADVESGQARTRTRKKSDKEDEECFPTEILF